MTRRSTPCRLATSTFRVFLSATMALGLCACGMLPHTPAAPAPGTTESSGSESGDPTVNLAARARAGDGRLFGLDADASTVRIYVFRGGLAARAGHNHILAPSRFEGLALVPDRDASRAGLYLRVPLDDLVVDDPAWREQTGEAFAGERSESDIEGTLRNLRGPRGLDTARYPILELRSMAVSGDWPILVADTAITLHGVTRVQPVMVEVRRDADDRLRATGSLVLRQSDFGIEPFSVLGGLMAVQDVVAVRFDLVGNPIEPDSAAEGQ